VRFTIEQRHLTDAAGKPVASTSQVSFHTFEAESADDAVRLVMERDNAELMGDIMKFPGFHAVATIKSAGGVFTLQVAPTSQSRIPVS
jgi:hypothetical protein